MSLFGYTDVVNAARGRLFCYGQFNSFEKNIYFSVAFDIVLGIFLLLPLSNFPEYKAAKKPTRVDPKPFFLS